ncbi:site-specific integrase [Campylobacter concisus]|uniref:site-specific integrase n=1 Tax=Campylobacter concisus TaxID=199 RepID=UPI001F54B5A0|nr:site-specific integrase [Campylobacter concisus]
MIHLKNRNGIYYYRSVIAPNARKVLKCSRELSFSLGTYSILKARKSARIYDRYIYLITKAVDMKLNQGIIDSLVDSFMQAKIDKSIKEHSLYDKKIDIDFADALNKHFKEALKDNTFPDLLNKSNETLISKAEILSANSIDEAIDQDDKASIAQNLLEKHILSLNYLISKLDKSTNLVSKRLKFLSKQDESYKFEPTGIDSFQDNINALDEASGLPLNKEDIKSLAKNFSHAIMVTAEQQYGLNTPFKLVKTKGDERSAEQILTSDSHLIGKRIKVGDSSFGMGSLNDEAVQEYEIVPCSTSQKKIESKEIITLKVAFENFTANTSVSQKWSSSTMDLVNIVGNILFKFFHPSKDITTISRDDLLKFRNTLAHIPTKLNQKAKYKDKSLEQIIRIGKNDAKLSQVTIQKYMIRVVQFFKYCYNSDYISKSIINDLNVKVEINPMERKVLPYSKEEANAIFKIVQNFKETNKSPSKRISANDLYYITMIAAYSGMRINEIVQLRARDIVQHNNVLCFSINRDDGKSTKNINSIRLVPVHSKLIELGLMEFVKQRASANKSIFKVSNKDFSEIFRSQIQRKLISGDKQKTFYSFRHYFIDTLVQQEVEPNIIAQIVGHEKQYKILLGTYATNINASVLKAKVEMVCY